MRNEDGAFLGNVFVLRDITEMKRLQADAQRNDRLAALGHLAAGVAHEYAALKNRIFPCQARKMRILQIRPTPAIASAWSIF